MVKYSFNRISGSATVFYVLEFVGEAYLHVILLVDKRENGVTEKKRIFKLFFIFHAAPTMVVA